MKPTENNPVKKAHFKLSFSALAAIVAGYYTLVVNVPIYNEFYHIFLDMSHFSIGFIVAIPLFIFCILNIVFNLFSWPYIAKPIFVFFIVSSSLVSYAMLFYGINVDYGMIENTFETDTGEVASYLSLQSLSWVGITGILPAVLVVFAPMKSSMDLLKKLIAMLLSALFLTVVLFFTYKDFSSVGRNNSHLKTMVIPTYYTFSIYQYLRKTYFSTPVEYREIGLDAKQVGKTSDEKPTLFLFILGETARSQNYALNGYAKNTNPYTTEKNVISFRKVSSCGTATALSVPCMFSQLKQEDYDKNQANSQDNVLDILKRAGVSLLWKENDGGDKGVSRHINTIQIDRSQVNQYCNGNTCLDMALLDGIQDDVANMQGRNKMLLMHIMGSHGPTYYKRYPKEQQIFLPDCPRSDIENCTTEEIINTYDNTIVYTDYIISEAIDALMAMSNDYNTALLYVSDHGESLGENGLFLHGVPRAFAPETQTTVPLITWMSEGFKNSKAIDETCLQELANTNAFSHDNLFSSLLGIMDVETSVYENKMDIFHPCRDE